MELQKLAEIAQKEIGEAHNKLVFSICIEIFASVHVGSLFVRFPIPCRFGVV